MDNFFTLPMMLIGVSELGVAVVGNVRSRKRWQKKYIKNTSEKWFNTIHWINYKRNF